MWFVRDKAVADATVEWSKQEFVVTSVGTDVDGLEVETVIEYIEETTIPNLKSSFVNNGNVDMSLDKNSLYSKSEDVWKCEVEDLSHNEFLAGYVICCPESVRIAEEQHEGEGLITNSGAKPYVPWEQYSVLAELGEYRMEIAVSDKSCNKLGVIWIEWIQQVK